MGIHIDILLYPLRWGITWVIEYDFSCSWGTILHTPSIVYLVSKLHMYVFPL